MVSVCLSSDALLQHLPSYLGFSYLGWGVSLHGCPSWPWMWSSSSQPSSTCAAASPWTWGSSSQQSPLNLEVGDWNAKVGSQETPGVTGKFGLGIRNKAGQRLIELCQENILVIANTLFQQHKRRLNTWASPDGQHQNQTDYYLQPDIIFTTQIITRVWSLT